MDMCKKNLYFFRIKVLLINNPKKKKKEIKI